MTSKPSGMVVFDFGQDGGPNRVVEGRTLTHAEPHCQERQCVSEGGREIKDFFVVLSLRRSDGIALSVS